jgi:sortase A
MRDKRPVDELTVDDLERILAIRRREQRQERLRYLGERGRRLDVAAPDDTLPPEPPQQHEAAEDIAPIAPPVTYDMTDDVPRFEDELGEVEASDDGVPRFEDELPPKPKPPAPAANGPAVPLRRSVYDKVLLGVEVLGVVGVVVVLALGAYYLGEENRRIDALAQKSADIQREAEAMVPTATPPPVLRVELSDYVLPGGHYSPDATGGEGAFNLEELPASIRPVAMAQLTAPQAVERTEQKPSSPVRIVIDTERVQVDASVYGGVDWEQLRRGVGHYLGSANPGEKANMVLSAHNDIYGEIFKNIQYLEPGDEIRIQAANSRWYTYVVFDKQIVSPTKVEVLERGTEAIVTLITCHPYRVDNLRMVVFAQLVESQSG